VPWAHVTHLIVGYLWPATSGSGYTLDVQAGVCGNLATFEANAAAYVTAGHAAGRKVSMLLGGAGGNPGNIWNTATSAGNVGGFAQSIVTMMKGLGIDGVDLDWEDGVEAPKLVALAKELRSRWPEGVITIPTGSTGSDAKDLAGAKDAVDAFEPMTYMVIQQWGGWHIPVPLTPLFAYSSNPYSVDIVRKAWIAAGVPASKIIMGIGGFGTTWTDTNGDGHAPVAPYSNTDTNGPADSETAPSFSDNAVTQKWLDKTLAVHPELVEGWDDVGKCSYWHAPAAGQLVTVDSPSGSGTVKLGVIFFESARSMGEKINYVDANGMKGFMFWTVSQLVDGTSFPVLQGL
jgi:GH18 family chitinase